MAEAVVAGKAYGIEVIPGVELSTEYENVEIHVVGLYIDEKNEVLCRQLQAFRDNRDNRNLKMIERLREEGYDLTAEELYALHPDAVLTRAHIARFLVDTQQVKDIPTVFAKLIGDGCKCYVDRMKITPMQAVELIHEAGGFAVLAHPCLYKMKKSELEDMVTEMTASGLDAIEAVYSCNQGSDEKDYKEMAERFGLLISGGSDFHGTNKPYIKLSVGKGNLKIPYEILENIKKAIDADK
ncbi:MAG: PHP domain-containing protein [Eubacterium sp.]